MFGYWSSDIKGGISSIVRRSRQQISRIILIYYAGMKGRNKYIVLDPVGAKNGSLFLGIFDFYQISDACIITEHKMIFINTTKEFSISQHIPAEGCPRGCQFKV